MTNPLTIVFLISFTLAVLLHAQDQSGFISIDCGLRSEQSYTDESTGINYTSDANFIDTGVSYSISSEYKSSSLQRQFWNVRNFPQGTSNCYTFNVPRTNSNKRLIRVMFMYGNYDGKHYMPSFDLYIESKLWGLVEFENVSSVTTKEMIYVASSDYIHVCLVNRNSGIPFISALEIRVLNNDTYLSQYNQSLELLERFDVGLQEGQIVRYPNDVYDRIWTPYNPYNWRKIQTSLPIDTTPLFSFKIPSIVQKTAATPLNQSDNLGFSYEQRDEVALIYVYMYFAEIEKLPNNEIREFNIYANGRLLIGPITLPFLGVAAVVYRSSQPQIEIWINRTEASTLAPLLNGIEVYKVKL